MDPLQTDVGGVASGAVTTDNSSRRENIDCSDVESTVKKKPSPEVDVLKIAAASSAGREGGECSQLLPKSQSEVQLPSELHPALLLERCRRIRAEQEVEAERQTCLELTRLLDLERRKVKQQARRPSTVSDSVAAARRRDSAGITISFGKSSPHQGESETEEHLEKKREDKTEVPTNRTRKRRKTSHYYLYPCVAS